MARFPVLPRHLCNRNQVRAYPGLSPMRKTVTKHRFPFIPLFRMSQSQSQMYPRKRARTGFYKAPGSYEKNNKTPIVARRYARSGYMTLKAKVDALYGALEMKSLETAVNNSPQTSTATITNLSQIAQGDTETERTGMKVTAKSIQFNGLIYWHVSATRSVFRVIIFVDKNDDGSDPVSTSLLTASNVYSLRNNALSSLNRFKILMDRTVVLDSNSQVAHIQFYKRLNEQMHYIGTSATSDGANHIWMLTISDEPTNAPVVNAYARLNYLDI